MAVASSSLLSLLLALMLQLGSSYSNRIVISSTKLGYSLFESHSAPREFRKDHVPSNHYPKVNLKIALKQKNSNQLKEILEKISHPDDSHYGQHLTYKQVQDYLTPDQTSLESVIKWLVSKNEFKESDLKWSHARDWINLEQVPLSKVEHMLDTKYHYYHHKDGEILLRTEQYSLPTELHEHIDFIQPTTMFGRLHRERTTIKSISNLTDTISPEPASVLRPNMRACTNSSAVSNECLRELYQTRDYVPSIKTSANMIGVTAFINERANFNDLHTFMSHQRPEYANLSFDVISVNGGSNPQQSTPDELRRHVGAEGNLDIQTTMGMTSPMKNVFYTIAGAPPFQADLFTTTNSNEPYLDWLDYMSSQADDVIPKVISTSFGDDEQTVPESYARRVCDQFAALGARGVSLLFSSGDNGVGEEGTCVSNDGQNRSTFIPIFPASCPYVTAVGATQNFHPEVAVSVDGPGGFTSGGGFSNYFSTPSYQSRDVQDYFQQVGQSHVGMYNPEGRGIPDVAAQGAKYTIVWQGLVVRIGGTSAATPTFSSVIALLNDYRISHNQPPLGFLNPWLYSLGRKGLNDITQGNSAGCSTNGFPASTGWDPVSGLGTPRFKSLRALLTPKSPRRPRVRCPDDDCIDLSGY